MFVVSQIFGYIALLFNLLTFISDNRKNILFVKAISSAFFTLNYLFLSQTVGAILYFVAIFRSIVFIFRDSKRWANSYALLFVFICISLVSPFLNYQGLITFLPALSSVLSVLGFYAKNTWNVYMLSLCSCALWLVYDALILNYAGLVAVGVSVVSILIGITLKIIKTKKQR